MNRNGLASLFPVPEPQDAPPSPLWKHSLNPKYSPVTSVKSILNQFEASTPAAKLQNLFGQSIVKPKRTWSALSLANPTWAGCRGIDSNIDSMVVSWGNAKQLARFSLVESPDEPPTPNILTSNESLRSILLDYSIHKKSGNVVAGSMNGNTFIWSPHSVLPVSKLRNPKDTSRIGTTNWSILNEADLITSQLGSVTLWDVTKESIVSVCSTLNLEVYCTALSAGDCLVGVANSDSKSRIFDLRSNAVISSIRTSSSSKPFRFTWIGPETSPARYFATCGFDGSNLTLKLWDLRATSQPTMNLSLSQELTGNAIIDYDPNTNILAMSSRRSSNAVFLNISGGESNETFSGTNPSLYHTSHSAFCLRSSSGGSKEVLRLRSDNSIDFCPIRLSTLPTPVSSGYDSSQSVERASILVPLAKPIIDSLRNSQVFGPQDLEQARQLISALQDSLSIETESREQKLVEDIERLRLEVKLARRDVRIADSQRTKAMRLLTQHKASSQTFQLHPKSAETNRSIREKFGLRRRENSFRHSAQFPPTKRSNLRLPFSFSFTQLHNLVYLRYCWNDI